MSAVHISTPPVCRNTYIELPQDDKRQGDEGKVGKLNASLCGTRDAQLKWERTYSKVFQELGFRRGVAMPCTFMHWGRGIRVAVHGDDVLVSGHEQDLHWLREHVAKKLEIQTVIIGPGEHQDKELALLNRTIRWGENGLGWEADIKHAEHIIEELGLRGASGVAAPCIDSIRELGVKRKDGKSLVGEAVSKYRRLVAIGNFLAADRADLQYTVRCLSQGMAAPSDDDQKALRHLGRYLVRQP